MKEINITKGQRTLVDNKDYEILMKHRWRCDVNGYAVRTTRNGIIKMQHFLIEGRNELCVDHINGNRLDNRRSNLRLCTKIENSRNRKVGKNNTSGYKGVIFFPKNPKKPWRVQISVNGIKKHIGYFKNKVEAAVAYNSKAIELYGDFARLNKF